MARCLPFVTPPAASSCIVNSRLGTRAEQAQQHRHKRRDRGEQQAVANILGLANSMNCCSIHLNFKNVRICTIEALFLVPKPDVHSKQVR